MEYVSKSSLFSVPDVYLYFSITVSSGFFCHVCVYYVVCLSYASIRQHVTAEYRVNKVLRVNFWRLLF